jgi:hypothetical protein
MMKHRATALGIPRVSQAHRGLVLYYSLTRSEGRVFHMHAQVILRWNRPADLPPCVRMISCGYSRASPHSTRPKSMVSLENGAEHRHRTASVARSIGIRLWPFGSQKISDADRHRDPGTTGLPISARRRAMRLHHLVFRLDGTKEPGVDELPEIDGHQILPRAVRMFRVLSLVSAQP